MSFHFGQLIAHLCKTRNARAGSIVGSGTVSNKDWSHGYSCIAEKRAIETIESGAAQTEYLKFGDTVRIEMMGGDGRSVFGADRAASRRRRPETADARLRMNEFPRGLKITTVWLLIGVVHVSRFPGARKPPAPLAVLGRAAA